MLALESNHIGVFHSKDLTLLLEAHASRSSTRLLLKILSRFSMAAARSSWSDAAAGSRLLRLETRTLCGSCAPCTLCCCSCALCLCVTCIALCTVHCALCWCVGQHSGGAGGRLVGRLCTPRWAASTRCTHHSALPQAASPLSVGCCESESALLVPLTHHPDHRQCEKVRFRFWDQTFTYSGAPDRVSFTCRDPFW